MKLFFSLILSFIFLNTSAQDCSDSVVVSIVNSSGMSGNYISKFAEYFDSLGNRTSRLIYRKEGDAWKKLYGYYYAFVYDSAGNIIDYLYKQAAGYLPQENKNHETFLYDSVSNLIEHVVYSWQTGAWQYSIRYHYYPDTAGNDTLRLIESGSNGTWQNSFRTYSEFNQDHLSIHDSSQQWNTTTLQWWLSGETFRSYIGTELDSISGLSYDVNGNITSRSYWLYDFDSSAMARVQRTYTWDGLQWVYYDVDSTFYDQWGNVIATDPWHGDYYTYLYDSLGNLLHYTYQGPGQSSSEVDYYYIDGILRYSSSTSSTQGGFTSSSGTDYRYADIEGSSFSCGSSTVQLTAQPCSPGNQFLWSTGETTSSITADTSTSYSVTITYPSGFTDSSFTFQVVSSPPAVMTLPGDTTLCITQNILLTAGGGFSSYLWQDSSISSSLLASSLFPDTILYSVLVSDSIGCSAADTMQIVFDACAGVLSIGIHKSEMILFPNPANYQFAVTLADRQAGSLQLANGQIEIFNTIGEKIYSAVYSVPITVNCERFPKGIYFVRISNPEKQFVEKLIIE